MQKVISIGKQNFVSLRENDCFCNKNAPKRV